MVSEFQRVEEGSNDLMCDALAVIEAVNRAMRSDPSRRLGRLRPQTVLRDSAT